MWHSQVMEPFFEAKDDLWIGAELAKRLGIDPKLVEPWPWKQEVLNRVADTYVLNEDGEKENLVTITQEDLDHYGVEGEPQQGRIGVREFQESGIYHVPRNANDGYGFIYLKEFRENPEENPAPSASGKLEIHCQGLADYVRDCGWSEIRPIPTYTPPLEGYEKTFADWDAKVKGDYSLQLYNVHMPRQAHQFFENVSVLREAFPHDFMMNPLDATPRGIENGDTVLVRSRWGKILRRVWVTNLMMPGVTGLGQGARIDLDEETGIDRGGCANTLKGPAPTGGGALGWNTTIVEVEKWEGEPLERDFGPLPLKPAADRL
jgi:anaerobic dimethyl sulfoxide reductase subunit A